MPNWNEVLTEIQKISGVSALDIVRRKYLSDLYQKTGRNIIAYYSGWLQKPGVDNSYINDDDKNGFMAAIHGMDRSIGLDLILHTPGGNIAATESIGDYLKQMFKNDIRVIVPQIAMSAGTMLACASKTIIMGKQSDLGPIDPQFGGIPCYGVIAEFERAIKEVSSNPETIPIWQAIVSKYHPGFLGECQLAIDWSQALATRWLLDGMFDGVNDGPMIVDAIVKKLNDHKTQGTHERHLNYEECERMGLKVERLEIDNQFQDLALTVHHSFMHTLANSRVIKIIENHFGQAMCQITL